MKKETRIIDEALEIGTRKCAVEAFVNMMGAALDMPEKKLHYWLDCYYQLRRAYELEREETTDDIRRAMRQMLLAGGEDNSAVCFSDGDDAAPDESPQPATPVAEVPEKPADETPKKSAKTSIKQETHARLMAARDQGVTIAQLRTASGRKLTESDICGMLNSMPLTDGKWQLMAKALDKIEGKEA